MWQTTVIMTLEVVPFRLGRSFTAQSESLTQLGPGAMERVRPGGDSVLPS